GGRRRATPAASRTAGCPSPRSWSPTGTRRRALREAHAEGGDPVRRPDGPAALHDGAAALLPRAAGPAHAAAAAGEGAVAAAGEPDARDRTAPGPGLPATHRARVPRHGPSGRDRLRHGAEDGGRGPARLLSRPPHPGEIACSPSSFAARRAGIAAAITPKIAATST